MRSGTTRARPSRSISTSASVAIASISGTTMCRPFGLDQRAQRGGIRHVDHVSAVRDLMPRRAGVAIDRDRLDAEALQRDHDFLAEFAGAEQQHLTATDERGCRESAARQDWFIVCSSRFRTHALSEVNAGQGDRRATRARAISPMTRREVWPGSRGRTPGAGIARCR